MSKAISMHLSSARGLFWTSRCGTGLGFPFDAAMLLDVTLPGGKRLEVSGRWREDRFSFQKDRFACDFAM